MRGFILKRVHQSISPEESQMTDVLEISFQRTEYHRSWIKGMVEMQRNQTFEAAFDAFCKRHERYEWNGMDFEFEYVSGGEVCMTDTPIKLGLEENVTIHMTRKVVYIELDIHNIEAHFYSRGGPTIKSKLSYTFQYYSSQVGRCTQLTRPSRRACTMARPSGLR
jgi:hypothetical protein